MINAQVDGAPNGEWWRSFKGFDMSRWTPVPDDMMDEVMPYITPNEYVVLSYIARRTCGFRKQADTISLNQFVHGITASDGREIDHGTGQSRPTVCRALKNLARMGLIVAVRQTTARGGDDASQYGLRMLEETAQQPVQEPVSRETGGYHSETRGVKRRYPQETVHRPQVITSNTGVVRSPERTLDGTEKGDDVDVTYYARTRDALDPRVRAQADAVFALPAYAIFATDQTATSLLIASIRKHPTIDFEERGLELLDYLTESKRRLTSIRQLTASVQRHADYLATKQPPRTEPEPRWKMTREEALFVDPDAEAHGWPHLAAGYERRPLFKSDTAKQRYLSLRRGREAQGLPL